MPRGLFGTIRLEVDRLVASKVRVAVLVTAAAALCSCASADVTANGTHASGGSPKATSKSANCPGRWAANTRGRPHRVRAGYRVWHDGRAWHLRTAGGTTGRRFVGHIRTAEPLRGMRAVHVETSDAVTRKGRRITVNFHTQGRDRDGIDFDVRCGRIEFDLGVEGTALPARLIHVGAAGRAPAQSFAAADPGASGVQGRVVIGPSCPFEGVPECADSGHEPVRTTVDVKRAAGKFEEPSSAEPVKSVATDGAGHFRVGLSAGGYTLTPRSPDPSLMPTPTSARVETGLVTRVELMLDTGLR
jgi:hypothetical protein